jgi:protein tyrosine/serine phosphatase
VIGRFPRCFALTLLPLALSGCFASSETKAVFNVHTVEPGVLLRGGQPDEKGLRELKKEFGVTTVVNFNDVTNDSEAKTAAKVGLNYLPLPDNPWKDDGDAEMIMQFLKVVRDRERNGVVYVHCKTGMERTGAAVAAYRVVECGWSAEKALTELRKHQWFLHAAYFQGIPPFVRKIERDREDWLKRLDEMPEPPVQRPEER